MVLSIGEGCSVFTLDPSLGEFVLTEPAVSPPLQFQAFAYMQAKHPYKRGFPRGPALAARLDWAAIQRCLSQSLDCYALVAILSGSPCITSFFPAFVLCWLCSRQWHHVQHAASGSHFIASTCMSVLPGAAGKGASQGQHLQLQ